jgi:hypothetical protein
MMDRRRMISSMTLVGTGLFAAAMVPGLAAKAADAKSVERLWTGFAGYTAAVSARHFPISVFGVLETGSRYA